MREKFADLIHSQWSGWMLYLFGIGTFNKDGSWTMPKEYVGRWMRQLATPYNQLPPDEQESDRAEAEKFLTLINDPDKAPIKKKYGICPSYVQSKNDGEWHFVTAPQLIRLYGVNSHECVVLVDESDISFRGKDLILLAPRTDGDYTIKPPMEE